MEGCIFCSVVEGKSESLKVWEDGKHIAILDRYPYVEGMTLVITKRHFDSYAFGMPDSDYSDLMLAAKKVARLLDRSLGVRRTSMAMEGLKVNHVHIKLYPVYDNEEAYRPGRTGPQVTLEKLKETAEKIKRGRSNDKVYRNKLSK